MAVISGKNGNVKWNASDLPDVRSWALTETANVKPYASSDTGGGMSRVAGQKDVTVGVELYLNSTAQVQAQVRPGDSGTLDCYENATLYWSVPAICETLVPKVEIEGGDPVGVSLTFGQTAAVTPPT